MFDFILEQLRIPWFTYADISCGSFPLDTIDTVSEDGSTDTESAIYLIANGVNRVDYIKITRVECND